MKLSMFINEVSMAVSMQGGCSKILLTEKKICSKCLFRKHFEKSLRKCYKRVALSKRGDGKVFRNHLAGGR